MPRTIDKARRIDLARQALDVIQRHGVHRVSMSQLAKELGVKRPTLYWYFKDLGEVFLAILEHTLEEAAVHFARRFAGVTHPIDLLDSYISAVREFYGGKEELIILLFQLGAVGDSDPQRIFERTGAHLDRFRDMAAALVRQGIAAGQVAECDPEVLVDMVSVFVDGLMVHRVARGIDPEPLHEMFRRRFLAPLRRPAGTDPGR